MEVNKEKIHRGNIVIQSHQFPYLDIRITWNTYNGKEYQPFLRVISISHSSKNQHQELASIKRKIQDIHNVQKRKKCTTVFVKQNRVEIFFRPNYKFNFI